MEGLCGVQMGFSRVIHIINVHLKNKTNKYVVGGGDKQLVPLII